MPQYKYRAKLPNGEMQAGVIEAPNPEAAQEALTERGAEPQLIEPYTSVQGVSNRLTFLLNPIKPKDLVVAIRTLSVMVSASLPLTDAVRNIARQTVNVHLKAVLSDVANEVEGGGRLSDAFGKYPKVFSGFFINMVRSGETTGQLADVLEYLADQQEKDYDLSAKISGAMIYPGFILSSMAVIAFIMMTFVVPKLVSVLAQANVKLPWTTRGLIATSGFFQSYWWLMLILIIGGTIGIRAIIATPAGRYYWDLMKLKIPIFGNLFQRVYVVRFSRSMATLVKGGVDTVSALTIVADVMDNEVWRQMVLATIREVNDGNSMTTVFERYKFVPVMMTQMLAVGEATGRTEEVLQRLSTFFSREIDNVVANLVSLIEPVVIIILGLGVGILVSAIMLPLYQLSSGAGIG
ncbi:MAG: type II secretion system F family protein [Patescibacteria group bacterium]